MIPILFPKNELSFTSNGLGKLSDAISCTVREELGGEFTLSMTYPVTGIHYSDIRVRNYIYVKPNQKQRPQPFRITKISRPINGQVTISAEHISNILSKIVMRPYEGQSAGEAATRFRIFHGDELNSTNLEGWINSYIQPESNRKFHFHTDVKVKGLYTPQRGFYIDYDGNYSELQSDVGAWYELTKPIDVKSFLTNTDDDSIRGIFGLNEDDDDLGEFEFDMFNVYLRHVRGSKTDIMIKYGRNLTDLTYEDDITEAYSAAIPYYPGQQMVNTAIAGVIDVKSYSPDPDYIWTETKALDMSQDNVFKHDPNIVGTPSPSYIQKRAYDWMQEEKVWLTKDNLSINFVELWNTLEYNNYAPIQLLGLGDEITVEYKALGVQVNKRIISYEWDCLAGNGTGRYSSVTLGDVREDMAKTIERVTKESRNFTMTTYEIINNNFETWVSSTFNVGMNNITMGMQQMNYNMAQLEESMSSQIQMMPSSIALSVTGQNLTKSTGASIILEVTKGDGTKENLSAQIKMTGDVLFASDVGSGGTTIISGDRIQTGTIYGVDYFSNGSGNFHSSLHFNSGSLWFNELENLSTVCRMYTANWKNAIQIDTPSRRKGIKFGLGGYAAWIGFGRDDGFSTDWLNTPVIIQEGLSPRYGNTHISQTLISTGGVYALGASYFNSIDTNDFGTDTLTLSQGQLMTSGSAFVVQPYSSGTYWFRAISSGCYVTKDLTVSGTIYGTLSSSTRNTKHSIFNLVDPELNPNKLYDLNVVQFQYIEQNKKAYNHIAKNMIGFIAEDIERDYPVAAVYKPLDYETNTPTLATWDERSIVAASVRLLQDQRNLIENLQIQVQKLEGEIDILKMQIIQNGS